MLELLDFLEDLRAAVGRGVMLEVQPVGPGNREVWRKRLSATGDPWLRWVEGGEGVGGEGPMGSGGSAATRAAGDAGVEGDRGGAGEAEPGEGVDRE